MFPSFADLFNAFVSKFREERPDTDPTIKGSWSGAFGKGIASIGYALVIFGKQIVKQFNPITATDVFLEMWASYDNITRLGTSPSLGVIRVYGDNGTLITSGERWSGSNGIIYENSVPTSIGPQDLDVVPIVLISVARVGSIVSADTAYPHGYSSGQWVKISGATPSEYNNVFEITNVPTLTTFEFTISGTPATPATGDISAIETLAVKSILVDSGEASITLTTGFTGFVEGQQVSLDIPAFPLLSGVKNIESISYAPETIIHFSTASSDIGLTLTSGLLYSIHANVTVQSLSTGPLTALPSGSELEYQGTISGLIPIAISPYGIQGGSDRESNESLRARLLISRSAQEGIFTNDQITLSALRVNGNTDVFIQNPDSESLADPDPVLPGQVRVYILRRNDPVSIIPNGTILALTKQSIIRYGRLPAEMWPLDLEVLAPELLPVDITMNNISPDTSSMRTAIKNQFSAYFTDSNVFGTNLDNDILRSVASLTKDLTAGNPDNVFLKRFDWVDTVETVAKNQLPVLGTVTINGTVVL
jgi:uncharacterized phage protein gp47/JayE